MSEQYEYAEVSHAKDWVMVALEEFFEQHDELFPALDYLIEIADTTVEILLKQGVVIPENVRSPYLNYELGK